VWKMALLPFIVFTNINEQELVVGVKFLLHIVNGNFTDALLGVLHNVEESSRVLVCHGDMIVEGGIGEQSRSVLFLSIPPKDVDNARN